MNKRLLLPLIIILFLGGFLFYQQGYLNLLDVNNRLIVRAQNIEEGINVGNKAPDFTLTNLQGKKVSLSDYRGKKVLINFWATWCHYCRQELPFVEQLYQEHDNVAVLTVNLNEPESTVAEFMESNGYNFPVLLDNEKIAATKYQVRVTPTNYMLNEKGIIINKHFGALTYEQILKLLEIK